MSGMMIQWNICYNNSPQVGGIVSTKQEGGVLIDMLLLQPSLGTNDDPDPQNLPRIDTAPAY